MIKNTTNPRAFRRGLNNVKVKDLPAVQNNLLQILGIKTKQMLRNYADGMVASLDVEKARQIEILFASYGVKDCWGES